MQLMDLALASEEFDGASASAGQMSADDSGGGLYFWANRLRAMTMRWICEVPS